VRLERGDGLSLKMNREEWIRKRLFGNRKENSEDIKIIEVVFGRRE